MAIVDEVVARYIVAVCHRRHFGEIILEIETFFDRSFFERINRKILQIF